MLPVFYLFLNELFYISCILKILKNDEILYAKIENLIVTIIEHKFHIEFYLNYLKLK